MTIMTPKKHKEGDTVVVGGEELTIKKVHKRKKGKKFYTIEVDDPTPDPMIGQMMEIEDDAI